LPVEVSGNAIELRQLYLLHEWRGAGAAKALMDWAIAEARGRSADELYLTVYVDNVRARRFYERYGFVEVGPYKFMVGEQADEDIIMRLPL
jgi:GNAT superfamily N-acetyltransferase